jgi:hypothetical protein
MLSGRERVKARTAAVLMPSRPYKKNSEGTMVGHVLSPLAAGNAKGCACLIELVPAEGQHLP